MVIFRFSVRWYFSFCLSMAQLDTQIAYQWSTKFESSYMTTRRMFNIKPLFISFHTISIIAYIFVFSTHVLIIIKRHFVREWAALIHFMIVWWTIKSRKYFIRCSRGRNWQSTKCNKLHDARCSSSRMRFHHIISLIIIPTRWDEIPVRLSVKCYEMKMKLIRLLFSDRWNMMKWVWVS